MALFCFRPAAFRLYFAQMCRPAALAVIFLNLILAGGVASSSAGSIVETYDDGTDIGIWAASFNAPRLIVPSGGRSLGPGLSTGAYLQQANVSSALPTWSSASTRFQPGFDDEFKQDSPFVGDWLTAGVRQFSVDLNVIQVGSWPRPGRPVTLQLLQMDDTGFNVTYVATYTTRLIRQAPVGWHRYIFPIGSSNGQPPPGWIFTRGDGTPAPAGEWARLLARIDLTSVGYYAPGYAYPGLGGWTLGIDNIRIEAKPVPVIETDSGNEEESDE